MKIAVLNILGFIAGFFILTVFFPIVLNITNYVISIPVIGDWLRFGTEHAYIVFPCSVLITSACATAAAYFICPPTKSGKKIGVIATGIVMIPLYANTVISLFKYNGYHFVFIVFALSAIISSMYSIIIGATTDKK